MSNLCAHHDCKMTPIESAGIAAGGEVFDVPVCDEHYKVLIRGR